MNLEHFIEGIYTEIPTFPRNVYPWQVIADLEGFIKGMMPFLNDKDFDVSDNIAVHKSATVESHVSLKGNTIIGPKCVVKSGAYLRNGVFLTSNVTIGANVEIKQSIILKNSCAAHLNYVGNSLIGSDVNLKAGSILANHFNERNDKGITVLLDGRTVETGLTKFGSLIGDGSRIGANSVLNPGTLLDKKSIVPRLTHIDLVKSSNI